MNNQIEQGCSYVSYFGHGGPCMWNGIYKTDNANALNNTNKYPVVFSMTCHAGNFAYSQQSLAEAFMQRSNAGAVAVIASSRESRSDSNYRYFFGEHSDSRYACAGLLRSLFPCVGTDLSQRARTIGQALEIGMIAVAKTTSDDFYNNTEMYNLLGDPTYQPYITTPKENKLNASSSISTGRNLMVSTVPDAMVCLSKDRTVIAAAMSDANGKVTLHVPATAPTGECTLYTSAPGYNDMEQVITLTAGNGSEELLDGTETPLNITYTDVISIETIGNILSNNWGNQQSFSSTTSPAQYLICAVNDLGADNVTGYRRWLNKDAAAEGIFIRDKHTPCSIVTTNSAGKARRVSIDWLHPTGMGEVIGVYGSNNAYNSTTQAWQGDPGEKIGELVKGYKDELTITKDYKYLLFRAEPNKQQPDDIRSYVFIRSLNIGWEATLQPCEKPQIDFAAGEFHFTCPTEGATFNYGITPSTEKEGQFLLTVTAVAPGYAPSEAATISFSGSELVKASGDIDENGIFNIADLTQLINKLHNK
ncbi:MAG: hypothetical protein KBT12_00810 [Bacteroidales bacterium]|nr:hypothetical protein [Candidatus Physcousia equi]